MSATLKHAVHAQTAISLWPQLEAVTLPLGSPAVASGADMAGSWLDQFMAQVSSQGLRVDFIALHWFGATFDAGTATSQLQQYLAAVYARFQRPIWLTQVRFCCRAHHHCAMPALCIMQLINNQPLPRMQFGLANFATNTFPTTAQSVAFLGDALSLIHHRLLWLRSQKTSKHRHHALACVLRRSSAAHAGCDILRHPLRLVRAAALSDPGAGQLWWFTHSCGHRLQDVFTTL